MAEADPLPEAQATLFVDFARAVSKDDPAIMEKAERFVKSAPTAIEDIGFYGMENAPAPERALRGIIYQLDTAGHFISVEDKYLYELAPILRDQGFADPAGLERAFYILEFFKDVEEDDEVDWPRFKRFFLKHTEATEKAVARKGFELLSVNLPLGDTLHYWLATPEEAAQWKDKLLYKGVNSLEYRPEPFVTFSVTGPNWGNYWDFMTYAILMPKEHWGRPDGL